jgi:hypothetical protein
VEFNAGRLRSGEWIAGASAIALLAVFLLLPWYGYTALPHAPEITGWQEFTHLRWLIVVTVAAALALALLQAACQAPALPVTLSVIASVLGALTSLWLIYRVLIEVPGSHGELTQRPAAYVGLLCALVLTVGAFRSLRTEDRPDPAYNAAIPTVALEHEG